MVRFETQLEIERLLAYEAYLLDGKRFAEWLDLFTDDATYTVSVRELVQPEGEGPPTIGLAKPPLVHETRGFMTTRIKRFDTMLAHAEQPPSLTRHLITNILIVAEHGDEVDVSSSFQVYQARIDISEHTFFGQRDDVLRRVEGEWKIARRSVVLDTARLPRTLSIFF